MSTETPSSWSPILAPDSAEKVLQVVEEIAADVRRALGELPADGASWLRRGPSLAGGDAGQAYFFSYLDQARPGRGYDDVAMEMLERAIDATASLQAPPGLYSGFSGVAWTLEHLRGRLFEDDGEDPGEEVIAALQEHVTLSPWRGHYDLISGLVGFAVYALERLPRPGGRECLQLIVDRLAEIAERRPDGRVTWLTGTELMIDRDLELHPRGNYNLGVAHGVPGVIGVLAQACAAGIDARGLLDGSVAWLLDQKLPAGSESIFPYNVSPTSESKASRLAWCYGDLGLATTLLMVARTVGEPAWEREALEIARFAAGRRDLTDAGVVDAGLCHGAGSAAHLFNRLYQATGDPLLQDAALYWLERTLAYRKPGVGVGGYEMWTVGNQAPPVDTRDIELGWHDDPGFLTGSAGVGLVLLAAATGVEPEWDRVLLADVPGRG